MTDYWKYWGAMARCAVVGSRRYALWMAALGVLFLLGLYSWGVQIDRGLAVSNMSNQVSWGAYIANFTFLVGIAAAAVLLVVPTYVYHRRDIKEVVLIGELLAVAAIVMCLSFVIVDLGRPDRLWHMLPGVGRLNFPSSVLAWDVLVLSVYLLLNLHIPGYLLWKRYRGEEARGSYYLPVVFTSILWAVSIHTVTAFLYSGLGGRPFWNSAILAPRFLVSAFASGPSLLILALLFIDRFAGKVIQPSVIEMLRKIVSWTIPLNFFLLGCELFKEFYTDTTHVLSADYLYFGLDGHAMLTPFIWTGLSLNLIAWIVFMVPALHRQRPLLIAAAGMCVIGVWVEKGMGLIIPGFIPSTSGDLVQYWPSVWETLISVGIWALGGLVFTVLAKVAIAIQRGDLRAPAREGGRAARGA